MDGRALSESAANLEGGLTLVSFKIRSIWFGL
jgi:hypothetical protein